VTQELSSRDDGSLRIIPPKHKIKPQKNKKNSLVEPGEKKNPYVCTLITKSSGERLQIRLLLSKRSAATRSIHRDAMLTIILWFRCLIRTQVLDFHGMYLYY